jgi:hypothetical protein
MGLGTDVAVTEIEGIGPAAAKALKRLGVKTALDLLKHPAQALHDAVSDLTSLDRVKDWRSMAVVMQVDGVSAQYAEALVRGGVSSLGELSHQSLDDLNTLFTDARAAHMTPDVPSTQGLVTMIVDATRLHYGGALSGRVLDARGRARAGVTLRLGYLTEVCDGAGRFRFVRIPLDWSPPLLCEWGNDHSYAFARAPISANASTVVEVPFELPTAWSKPPEAAHLPTASEWDGDPLPRLTGQRLRAVEKPVSELRHGDVMVVNHIYKNEPYAKLASRLRTYTGGEVLVFTYRVPMAGLPPAVKPGDNFKVVRGAFVPIEVTPQFLHYYRIKRQALKHFSRRRRPRTRAEKETRFREVNEYIKSRLPGTR